LGFLTDFSFTTDTSVHRLQSVAAAGVLSPPLEADLKALTVVVQHPGRAKNADATLNRDINGRVELTEKVGDEYDEKVAIRIFTTEDKEEDQRANERTMLEVIQRHDIPMYRVFHKDSKDWANNAWTKERIQNLGRLTKDPVDIPFGRPSSNEGFLYAGAVQTYLDTYKKPQPLIEFGATKDLIVKKWCHDGGVLATVLINGRYMNGGSHTEHGWVVNGYAPMKFVGMEDCGEASIKPPQAVDKPLSELTDVELMARVKGMEQEEKAKLPLEIRQRVAKLLAAQMKK
jgi:hypothetical protein